MDILTLPETLCDAIHRQRRCASGGKLSESRNTFFTPQQSSSAWWSITSQMLYGKQEDILVIFFKNHQDAY